MKLHFPLPEPGEIVQFDFRSKSRLQPPSTSISPITLVQWNIERGYQLQSIISELGSIDADIVALQEVDVHCERSNWEDTGAKIAKALGYNYAFVCEFLELHSHLRDKRSQGGGAHGNAILSKFDLSNLRALEHTHHPVDWEHPSHKLAQREPRKGRRLTLFATAATPQGPLDCYSAHLEVFSGITGRIRQFADIARDVRSRCSPHVAVLGDLNTMAHGVARLSPHYACDALRWRTLGSYEAEVWAARVFAVTDPPDGSPPPPNPRLLALGLEPHECRDATNPFLYDPFDPRHDVTLDNPTYRVLGVPLMSGKLDWVLLRGLQVVSKALGNHDYSSSDHKWLLVGVTLSSRNTWGEHSPPVPSSCTDTQTGDLWWYSTMGFVVVVSVLAAALAAAFGIPDED